MNLRSKTIVTSVEDGDYLEFTLQHESGWIELLLIPAFATIVGLLSWRDRSWLLALSCMFVIIFSLVKWSRRIVCRVSVNSRELLVTANVTKYPNRIVRYAPHAVTRLRYFIGNEDEPSGLYLNDICILPGISEDEAGEIVAQIVLKFPQYDSHDMTRASMLHGDDSGITVLGLN